MHDQLKNSWDIWTGIAEQQWSLVPGATFEFVHWMKIGDLEIFFYFYAFGYFLINVYLKSICMCKTILRSIFDV